jgi:hypothetical protein
MSRSKSIRLLVQFHLLLPFDRVYSCSFVVEFFLFVLFNTVLKFWIGR